MLYFHRIIFSDTLNVRIVIRACLGAWGMPFDLERGHGHASKKFVVPPTHDGTCHHYYRDREQLLRIHGFFCTPSSF